MTAPKSAAEAMRDACALVCDTESDGIRRRMAIFENMGNDDSVRDLSGELIRSRNRAALIRALPLSTGTRAADILRLKAENAKLRTSLESALAAMEAMHPAEDQLTAAELARLWNATMDTIRAALAGAAEAGG